MCFPYFALTLLRDGMARIINIVYNLDTLNHAILRDWTLPTTSYPRGEKFIWILRWLGSNSGRLHGKRRAYLYIHGLSGIHLRTYHALKSYSLIHSKQRYHWVIHKLHNDRISKDEIALTSNLTKDCSVKIKE